MSETIQPHILVVDDDAQIRALLEEYLTENQLRVSVVSGGQQMSQILEEMCIRDRATNEARGPRAATAAAPCARSMSSRTACPPAATMRVAAANPCLLYTSRCV